MMMPPHQDLPPLLWDPNNHNLHDSLPELTAITREQEQRLDHRSLENGFQSLFADSEGNTYEPYALAWRYLGVYMDCDLYEQRQRELAGGNQNNGGKCERKLLWAAYIDKEYRGGEIGEYQFYDPYKHAWNKESCQTRRCAKMDCHEPSSHWKLLGLYKETNGLYDWFEQLFKHEGYCVWNDEDVYKAMATQVEEWPQGCTELDVSDGNNSTLYSDIKPLPGGNITIGVYLDNKCVREASLSWSDYILAYFGSATAAKADRYIAAFNEYMTPFKYCQPCRTYNLHPERYNQYNRRVYEVGDEHRRSLADEEKWGYNCYDYTGSTNVNQCSLFETKTSLAVVDDENDLTYATDQATILSIKVGKNWYGYGGPRSTKLWHGSALSIWILNILILCSLCGVFLGLAMFLVHRRRKQKVIRKAKLEGLDEKEQQLREDEDEDEEEDTPGIYAELKEGMLYFYVDFLVGLRKCLRRQHSTAMKEMSKAHGCGDYDNTDDSETDYDDFDAAWDRACGGSFGDDEELGADVWVGSSRHSKKKREEKNSDKSSVKKSGLKAIPENKQDASENEDIGFQHYQLMPETKDETADPRCPPSKMGMGVAVPKDASKKQDTSSTPYHLMDVNKSEAAVSRSPSPKTRTATANTPKGMPVLPKMPQGSVETAKGGTTADNKPKKTTALPPRAQGFKPKETIVLPQQAQGSVKTTKATNVGAAPDKKPNEKQVLHQKAQGPVKTAIGVTVTDSKTKEMQVIPKTVQGASSKTDKVDTKQKETAVDSNKAQGVASKASKDDASSVPDQLMSLMDDDDDDDDDASEIDRPPREIKNPLSLDSNGLSESEDDSGSTCEKIEVVHFQNPTATGVTEPTRHTPNQEKMLQVKEAAKSNQKGKAQKSKKPTRKKQKSSFGFLSFGGGGVVTKKKRQGVPSEFSVSESGTVSPLPSVADDTL